MNPRIPRRGQQRWRPGTDPAAHRTPATSPRRPSPPGNGDVTGAARRVAVVGGGIAGLAAATVLAERGVTVTLLEREDSLGGRVRSWPVEAEPSDGVVAEDVAGQRMSRGFHAFFRQYYTLRALLQRVDPELAMLRPVADYPLVHADGSRDSFTTIPRRPPWNILGFVAQSPSFRLADLPRVNVAAALGLLDVDFPRTFVEHDGVDAEQVLARLRFPPAMRSLALEVFARSFFADARDFSGGELVGMFHTYFLGSAEGLLFDVPDDDFDTALWGPLAAYLSGLGVDIRCGTTVDDVTLADPDEPACPLRVSTDGEQLEVDALVLAVDRGALQRLVERAPWLRSDQADWRGRLASLRLAPRFVVLRQWLDRPVAAHTPPFVGTAGLGRLDNVSAIHLLEAGAARWAERTGGSVVELHAYAVPDEVSDDEVVADLRAQLARLHPELASARVVHEELLIRQDCPLPGTDPWATRPGVTTPDPRVVLAGDGIRCELPVALMERAAVTGVQAANALLAGWGLTGEDIWSVPVRGRYQMQAALLRAALGRRQP